MTVVNIFYELARTHKKVKGFQYKKTFEKGAGNDKYPLVWLDDPIASRSAPRLDQVEYIANVDFLDIPETEADVERIQSEAQITGLAFIERMREKYTEIGSITAFNSVTLRDYYDDNAAGQRFTFTLILANPVDRCADYFDEDKVFDISTGLPEFSVDHPNGCAVFSDGLPNFDA